MNEYGRSPGCPRIAISLGDVNGIGPEVTLKVISDHRLLKYMRPILIGPSQAIGFYAGKLDLEHVELRSFGQDDTGPHVAFIDTDPDKVFQVETGAITPEAGRHAMLAVEIAVDLCISGDADAMVTAPISKEAISRAGYREAGHTDFIANLVGSDRYIMMMIASGLRIGLVTTHVPVSEIPGAITREVIREKIHIIHRSLHEDFGIIQPKIAVLGLNPHAGDGGVIGREEIEIISPAIRESCAVGEMAFGPFAADGFFASRVYQRYDAVLAMYHDQGLVPFKTLAFNSGINFTAGIPIVRTSPDHGTAYDIAGRGKASPESMRHAVYLAMDLARKRSGIKLKDSKGVEKSNI